MQQVLQARPGGWDFPDFLQHWVPEPHLVVEWPRCQHFLHLKGLGIDCLTLYLITAIFTLSGIGEEKVRITFSEKISG